MKLKTLLLSFIFIFTAQLVSTRPSNAEESLMNRVIAHRGDSDHFPENTLIAIKTASENGADIIEFDIHLSKDGVPVVIHDAKLSRTTSGHGYVQNKTVSELKKLSAGYADKFGDEFLDEKIPTLREVFDSVPKEQILFVEIKKEAIRDEFDESAEYIAFILAMELNRLDTTVFISFDERVAKRLNGLKFKKPTKIYTGFIASPWSLPIEDPIEKAKELGVDWGVFSKKYVTGDKKAETPVPQNPDFGKDRGDLKLALWTFGEPLVEEVLQFVEIGADALASNSPKETKELLKQKGK